MSDSNQLEKIYCWAEGNRLCCGDCQAFNPATNTSTGDLTFCRIVNSLDILSKSMVTIAKAIRSSSRIPGSMAPPPEVL
jgi:hypothetical protein